jgi:hypothetical protein
MYLANPITVLGLFGLCMALLLLPWRITRKTAETKKAANAVVVTLTVLGLVWAGLGAIMGFNHMAVRPGCMQQLAVWEQKRAAKQESDRLKAQEQERLAKLTPEQKAELEAKLTPEQKAEQEAKAKARAEADKAFAEGEKEFMARCNTVITRYSETTK